MALEQKQKLFEIVMQKETIIQGILMCLFYLEYLCLYLPYSHYKPYRSHSKLTCSLSFLTLTAQILDNINNGQTCKAIPLVWLAWPRRLV